MLDYRQDNSVLAACREGDWKLKLPVQGGASVYARRDHGELPFDLRADPGEMRDLSADMPVEADEKIDAAADERAGGAGRKAVSPHAVWLRRAAVTVASQHAPAHRQKERQWISD